MSWLSIIFAVTAVGMLMGFAACCCFFEGNDCIENCNDSRVPRIWTVTITGNDNGCQEWSKLTGSYEVEIATGNGTNCCGKSSWTIDGGWDAPDDLDECNTCDSRDGFSVKLYVRPGQITVDVEPVNSPSDGQDDPATYTCTVPATQDCDVRSCSKSFSDPYPCENINETLCTGGDVEITVST